ncbi:polyprenyl diphosphate synthase [Sodalis-like secondary symbiont of Drepanosiphum platanoidis]|uniref:polyprenyl diphosphate synthase n=1 Tax=Sodalis-like secondary symbiont of Drepanosiphum platanoidis TaxID=2994493 RepID=UPI003464ABC7
MKKLISNIPNHIAIIMDGNSRWAKKLNKLPIFGHKAGIKSMLEIIFFSIKSNLKSLTLFAFSSENWNRSPQELSELINLFTKKIYEKSKILNKYNVKIHIIGNILMFNKKFQKNIKLSEKLTYNNTGLILNIAINYGGRWDIIEGIKKFYKKIIDKNIKLKNINENIFNKYICLNKQKPIDLLIRTGGELRISNFLLWQIAYSEFFFTDILWPDFKNFHFKKAIYDFSKRKRRFGKSS